jgi:hypothetical protein
MSLGFNTDILGPLFPKCFSPLNVVFYIDVPLICRLESVYVTKKLDMMTNLCAGIVFTAEDSAAPRQCQDAIRRRAFI